MNVKAYLEITMKIDAANRPAAAKVYTDYRQPFLTTIKGAFDERPAHPAMKTVQVLHGFDSTEHAQAYLTSDLFKKRRLRRTSASVDRRPGSKDLYAGIMWPRRQKKSVIP